MTSSASYSYHIIPPSSFILELTKAGCDDQNHHQLLTRPPKSEASSSSNSSFPFSSPLFYCSPAQDQVDAISFKQDSDQYFEKLQFIPQQVDHKLVSHGDQPRSHHDHRSFTEDNDDDQRRNHDLSVSMWKKEDEMRDDHHHHDQADKYYSVKWMSSKMRIMRKMISSSSDQETRLNVVTSNINNLGGHQKQLEDPKQLPSSVSSQETDHSSSNSSYNSSTIVRVCADCNTTKTPLWRSGPRGPKSLCNACGIRQRKARRAAAAAAAANGEPLPPATLSPKPASAQHKNKRSSIANKSMSEPKKKSKAELPICHHHQLSDGGRKLCLEEFALQLSKHLAFQRVFPQEEKEAAILLMALSYGLDQG